MLTSLIAVLLLLGIGVVCVISGAVGRAGGEETLSPPKRIVMLAVGLSALGVAYMVYSNPRSLVSSSERAPQSWNAMPSNPPESRGAPAADPDAAAAADALATVSTGAAQLEAGTAAEPAEPAAVEPEPVPAADGGGEVSAAALAMEAELMRRRKGLPALASDRPQSPAVPAAAEPAQAPAVAAVPATPPPRRAAPAPARRNAVAGADGDGTRSPASARRAPVTPVRRPLPLNPLTIVIHNELGERQQRETLSLVIEGKRVASFEITDAAPYIELPIRLPRPGLIHYKLEGESVQGRRQTLRGQGCISAVDGARFQVRCNPGSQRVFLESVSG